MKKIIGHSIAEDTAIKAYSEIIKVLYKHRDICVYDIEDLERRSEHHLFGIRLKETHGFNIDPKTIHSCDWINLGDYVSVGLWGEEHRRKISWPDNGKQPKNEMLLQFSFPTGAYIFGEDYPTDLFQKMFMEIISYSPKYIDSHNSSIYFSMDNAGIIFNEFKNILKKYHELNKADYRQRQIVRLEESLAILKTT